MLAVRRIETFGKGRCSRRQQAVALTLGAAGWPDVRSLFSPVNTTANSVVRCRTPYSILPGPAGSAAAAATAGGGGGGTATSSAVTQPEFRFRLRRIYGDGACMFRAIAQGAQVATHGNPMSGESEEVAAQNLRQAVVRELRRRREEIEPFLPGITTDFEEYCRTMSHPMAWGGEPEMVMAVHVVQRPIMVYHVHDGELAPIVTYGDHLMGAKQPISLLWSGAHYDLLVPEGPGTAATAA